MSIQRRIIAGTIVALLLQALALGAMVAKHAYALRSGATLVLKATPVDPRHLLLGHYLVLGFPISTADRRFAAEAGAVHNQVVYAALEQAQDGGWKIAGLHSAMPPFSPKRPVLRALLRRGHREDRLLYGIERYYLDQRAAKAMEQRVRDGEVQLEVAVSRSTGRAAIRRILVNGKPAYRDPLF